MTDKQSTVVVSRELAERLANKDDFRAWGLALSELRAILAAPVEQQGEPFCFTTCGMIGIATEMRIDGATGRIGCKFEKSDRFCVPLYRHSQPAPKVVLPGRQVLEPGEDYLQSDFVSGWNACLDEITKLNGLLPCP